MKRGILWHQLRKIGVKYHIFAYRRIENAARASRNGCMRTKMRKRRARCAKWRHAAYGRGQRQRTLAEEKQKPDI